MKVYKYISIGLFVMPFVVYSAYFAIKYLNVSVNGSQQEDFINNTSVPEINRDIQRKFKVSESIWDIKTRNVALTEKTKNNSTPVISTMPNKLCDEIKVEKRKAEIYLTLPSGEKYHFYGILWKLGRPYAVFYSDKTKKIVLTPEGGKLSTTLSINKIGEYEVVLFIENCGLKKISIFTWEADK